MIVPTDSMGHREETMCILHLLYGESSRALPPPQEEHTFSKKLREYRYILSRTLRKYSELSLLSQNLVLFSDSCGNIARPFVENLVMILRSTLLGIVSESAVRASRLAQHFPVLVDSSGQSTKNSLNKSHREYLEHRDLLVKWRELSILSPRPLVRVFQKFLRSSLGERMKVMRGLRMTLS